MTYDCFIFFNEIDLLEIRLNILKDVVDRFVLVEATRTHTGNPKPLYYAENRARFAKFEDRITHVVVDDFPSPTEGSSESDVSWMRENFQRNAIMRGLLDAKPDDLILISDLDEIPRPEIFGDINRKWEGISVCEQMFMNFYVNYLDHVRPRWRGTRIQRMAVLQEPERHVAKHYAFIEQVNRGMTPTRIRFSQPDHVLKNAGWHFSYLGGSDSVLKKIRSVGLEYEGRYQIDQPALHEIIERGEDITHNGGRFFAVPVGPFLPRYITEHISLYSSLVYQPTLGYYARTRLPRFICLLRGKVHRFVARLLPRFAKPMLFNLYCKLVRNPINQ